MGSESVGDTRPRSGSQRINAVAFRLDAMKQHPKDRAIISLATFLPKIDLSARIAELKSIGWIESLREVIRA